MTDAEKDAVWRSLPEDYKKEMKEIYEALECDSKYKDGYAQAMLMHTLFGKHNLTATEEPIQDKTMEKGELLKLRKERRKQTLNIGDKVRAISASGKPLHDGKVATIIEKGMSGNEVYYGLYIEGVTVENRSMPLIGKSEIIGNTSLLAPFFAEDLELVTSRTKKEKPKEETLGDIANDNADWAGDELPINKVLPGPYKIGDLVRFSYGNFCNLIGVVADFHKEVDEYSIRELVAQNSFELSVKSSKIGAVLTEKEPTRSGERVDSSSSLQNEIPSMSKEDAEELAKCLAEMDDTINKFKDSQVDWLAYRMELAKDTLRYITSCSTQQEMNANELADYVMTTVDGIVERLK